VAGTARAGHLSIVGPLEPAGQGVELTYKASIKFLQEKENEVVEEQERLQVGTDRRAAKKVESKAGGLLIWAGVTAGGNRISKLNGNQVCDVLLFKGATIPAECTKLQQRRGLIATLYGEEVDATRAAAAVITDAPAP
jgi:hypothetical protein